MKESFSISQTLSAAQTGTTLRIHFPETTVTEAATNVTIAASAPTPTLSMSVSALKSTTSGSINKYLAFSIDLDAPFPAFPFLGPGLHGVHADLVAGAADANGFVALEGGSAEWQVAPYMGPGPPPLSAPHRYVFMVFEQPEGMDTAKVKSVLGLDRPATSVLSRIRWDQAAAEKSLGLGEVVAGNYFVSRR